MHLVTHVFTGNQTLQEKDLSVLVTNNLKVSAQWFKQLGKPVKSWVW